MQSANLTHKRSMSTEGTRSDHSDACASWLPGMYWGHKNKFLYKHNAICKSNPQAINVH